MNSAKASWARVGGAMALLAMAVLAAACGQGETDREAAGPAPSPSEAPASPAAVAATVVPAPPSPTPTPTPPPTLAIAPVFNPSRRWVHRSELLREYLPLAVGGAFEASGGGALAATRRVETAFAGRGLDTRQSVPDATLIEIARELDVPFLLSWEPDQDEEELRVRLHLRLASSREGEIVYRQELASSSDAAFYITFLNLYDQGIPKALEAALWAVEPGRRALADTEETTPTRHLAHSLGELARGDYLPGRIEDVRRRPGDPEAWAFLSRAYSRLAAALKRPTATRKRLAARAMAAAQIGRLVGPDNPRLRQASAFAYWVNGLEGRAEADLEFAAERADLDGPAKTLWELVGGKPPLPDAPDSEAPGDGTGWIAEPYLARWWRDGPMTPDECAEATQRAAALLRDACAHGDTDVTQKDIGPGGFDARAFVQGQGPHAEALREAMTAIAQTAKLDSGALLAWGREERAAVARALAAEAWLASWEAADLGAGDVDLSDKAFRFARSLFMNDSSIFLAEARFHDQTAPDPARRNEALSNAVRADPDYAPAARLAAKLRESSTEFEKIGDLYERVRTYDPFDVDLICWAGRNLTRLGLSGRARAVFGTARSIAPRDPGPFLGLLDVHARIDLREIESGMVARLLASYPVTPALRLEAARLYYENDQADRAVSLAASLARAHPDRFEPAALLARAHAFLGRQTQMSQALGTFLDANPPPAELTGALDLEGDLLLRRRAAAEAEAAYARALEANPQSAPALLGLARSRRMAGREDEAIEAYQRLGQTRSATTAALEAGRILLERRELDKALALASEAQALRPEAAGGYALEAWTRLAQGNPDGALAALDRLAEEAPRNPYGFLARSRILTALSRFNEAVEAAGGGLGLHNDRSDPLLRRALVAAAIEGDYVKDARGWIERLERFQFNDPDAQVLFARADLDQGKQSRSRTHLAVALRICPAHAPALALRAVALLEEGRTAEAAEAADQALEAMVGFEPFALRDCAKVWEATGRDQDAQAAQERLARRGVTFGQP